MAGVRGWLERYLEAIQAERDAARNTLLSYARDLNDFAGFLAARGRDYASADRADIEAYLVDQADRGMAQATRARRLSAIRQFYRFAFLEGWRTDDPAALIKGPKRERALPGSLSEAEVDRLLAAAETLGRTAGRAAARRLPDAGALRHRPPGQRAGVAAAGGGARRPADDPDPRQGRARAHGAAVAAGARRRSPPGSPHLDGAEAGEGAPGPASARPTCSRRAGGAAT